jgi:hypothetical protein
MDSIPSIARLLQLIVMTLRGSSIAHHNLVRLQPAEQHLLATAQLTATSTTTRTLLLHPAGTTGRSAPMRILARWPGAGTPGATQQCCVQQKQRCVVQPQLAQQQPHSNAIGSRLLGNSLSKLCS